MINKSSLNKTNFDCSSFILKCLADFPTDSSFYLHESSFLPKIPSHLFFFLVFM